MTVLHDQERFHLAMDTIDRLAQAGDRGIYLRRQLEHKLLEHKQYTHKHGQDLPEIRKCRWKDSNPGPPYRKPNCYPGWEADP
jgi:xylulose-5-phosphate/fructose-6-phosphate phosphoketolase